MMNTNSDIRNALAPYIQKEIETAIEEEIETLHKRIEERVRGRVGSIVANVLERFSMERFGSELVIRVEINKP